MAEIKEVNSFHIFSSAYVCAAVNSSEYVKDEKKAFDASLIDNCTVKNVNIQ